MVKLKKSLIRDCFLMRYSLEYVGHFSKKSTETRAFLIRMKKVGFFLAAKAWDYSITSGDLFMLPNLNYLVPSE